MAEPERVWERCCAVDVVTGRQCCLRDGHVGSHRVWFRRRGPQGQVLDAPAVLDWCGSYRRLVLLASGAGRRRVPRLSLHTDDWEVGREL